MSETETTGATDTGSADNGSSVPDVPSNELCGEHQGLRHSNFLPPLKKGRKETILTARS